MLKFDFDTITLNMVLTKYLTGDDRKTNKDYYNRWIDLHLEKRFYFRCKAVTGLNTRGAYNIQDRGLKVINCKRFKKK